MTKLAHYILLLFLGLSFSLYSQCATDVETGVNLVKNYDFSQGYTDWTHDPSYQEFVICGSSCYSRPGYVFASTDPSKFNASFPFINDHSTSSDNMMLMVDGLCTPGIQLWSQANITVKPNTNYYFSLWLASLYTNTTFQGTLRLAINGTAQTGTITPPSTTAGTWIQYQVTLNSGSNTSITLSLENTTASGCDNGVDFAIDDITFTPGCQFGAAGPQPDLGADRTICGTGGSITLNSGVTAVAGLDVKWNDGLIGTGTTAPVSRVITSPGTYSVCMTQSGSCVKSSVVTISNTFSINIDDALLCDPVTTTLDAVYTGPGVKYKWYKGYPKRAGGNDSAKTFLVTSAGTYRVDVIDPVCGTKSDVATITSFAATPVDGTYCTAGSKVALGVTGSGKYKWCSNATGTCTKIGAGPSYTTPALTPSATYTYYVQDTSTFSMTIGPSMGTATDVTSSDIGVDAARGYVGFINAYGNAGKAMPTDPTQDGGVLIFNADNDFKIDSISVFVLNYYCAAGVTDDIKIEILDANNNPLPGSPASYSAPCKTAGALAGAYKVQVPIGISIPKGDGYKMRLPAGSASIAGFLNATNGGATPTPVRYTYATTYNDVNNDPVATFQSNSAAFSLYSSPTAFPGYFDWKISKGLNCQRVPVRALYACTTPVNFLDFSVEPSDKTIMISFKTTQEARTQKYLIQSATNGYDFITIGEITNLQHQAINSYSFKTSQGESGTYYFRIVEVGLDGSLMYSNTKQAILSSLNNVRLFPNPSQGATTLQIDEDRDAKITVLNTNGHIIDTFLLSDTHTISFGSHYQQGIYLIEITTDNSSQVLRFVKE